MLNTAMSSTCSTYISLQHVYTAAAAMPLKIHGLSPYVCRQETLCCFETFRENGKLPRYSFNQSSPLPSFVRFVSFAESSACIRVHWKAYRDEKCGTYTTIPQCSVYTRSFPFVGCVDVGEWKNGRAKIKQENLSVQI